MEESLRVDQELLRRPVKLKTVLVFTAITIQIKVCLLARLRLQSLEECWFDFALLVELTPSFDVGVDCPVAFVELGRVRALVVVVRDAKCRPPPVAARVDVWSDL